MDLHKLRIFAAIARTGSFSRAAESVFVTQPTASQQLAQLEFSLGVKLLERGTRRARLTPAGEALLPYAEQILTLVETAAESARAAAGIADRTLRLGVGHTLAAYVLPNLLRDYRERFPDRRVKMTLGNTAELLDLIDSGSVELALVGSPAARAGLALTPFLEDRIVVITTAKNASRRNSIRIEELLAETLLVRESGSALHATVEQILGPGSLAGDKVIQLGETEAIKRSVEAGLGFAIIQEIAVQDEVSSGRLRILRLDGVDDRRSYALAHKENRLLSQTALDFIDQLTRIAATP